MAYPSTIPSFTTKINKNASGWYVGPEYFNVPTATPWEIYLDHVPMTSATTVIGASGGAAWTEVDDTPDASHEYSVSYTTGLVTFYSGDSGTAVQATYYNLGDDVMAQHMNDVQDNIVITDTILGLNPAGSYSTVVDRLNAVDVNIYASGIDGSRLTDDTVRAGALKSDIKGATWEATRDVLTDISDHTSDVSAAHAASAISAAGPGDTAITNVQAHIDQVGSASGSPTNPHGMTIADLGDGSNIHTEYLFARVVGVSGNFLDIGVGGDNVDQYVYFNSNSNSHAKHLRWAEASGVFELNDSLYSSWDSRIGGDDQYFAVEALDLGLGGIYPMLCAYSDGLLGGIGAISRALIIYDTDDTKYPQLVFSSNDVGTTGVMTFDVENSRFRIHEDLVPDSSGTLSIGTASDTFGSVYTETAHVVAGANGTFTTVDGKTVTVTGGIITSIV